MDWKKKFSWSNRASSEESLGGGENRELSGNLDGLGGARRESWKYSCAVFREGR